MKNKIFVFFLVWLLVFTNNTVTTASVRKSKYVYDNDIDNNINSKNEIYTKKLNVLKDLSADNENAFSQTRYSFDESKDQHCESGNRYYDSSTTSIFMVQSFKPSMNWFTKLSIYLKKSSDKIKNGTFCVTIRNATNENDWLGASAYLESVPNSGGWLEFPCEKPFPMFPGHTYYIVIRLLTILPSGENFNWRYGQDNPYPRGQAYISIDSGGSWISKNDWDFNFQTWGISTSPPNKPNNPFPPTGSEDQDLDIDISWSGGDPDGDSVTYDVYFGISTPPTLVTADQSQTFFNPGELLYDSTYYWKIISRDSHGVEREGPIWNFRTKSPPPGPPIVSFVETYYADGSSASDGKGFFLQGMHLENRYTAFVIGNNVDKVEFKFGQLQYTDINSADGWTATFDTQYIINPAAELKVRAHNDYGWSEVKKYSPRIIPIAGWLVNYLTYISDNNQSKYIKFSICVRDFPPRPKNNFWILEAKADFSKGTPENNKSPVDVGVDCPVEKVGGQYSYSGGIGCSVVICSDGTIEVNGEYGAEVEAKSVAGSIGASLNGHLFLEKNNIIWDYMYITINGEVTIPVFIIPFEICGIGVEAGIDITPSVEITFELEPVEGGGGLVPGLGIKIKDDGGISGNVAAKVRAYAELGIVIGDLYAEAGGSGTIYFRTPPSGSLGYLDKFVLSCWIGGRIRFLFWTAEGWWNYDWIYPGGMLTAMEYNEEDWEPLDRDYITPDQGHYNQYVWDNSENSNVGKIIENVFPHANPSIASDPYSSGTRVMIVWSHDNKNKPKVKGMEIWYTIWDKWAGGMSTPKVIPTTDDNMLQMDPKIAYDKNGNVVCVFVQTDDSISENSDYNDVASSTEIAYCVWNKNSKSWSDINLLTDNDRMDISPVLSSNDDGDVVLVWSSDGDNDKQTIMDRTIYSSIWDGSSWSSPIKVVENRPVVTTPQVAFENQNKKNTGFPSAICVFSMDEDNNPSTTDDQEVYYAKIDYTESVSNLTKFTNDGYQDTSPSIVCGLDGNSYIVWLKKEYHTNGQGLQEISDGDGTLYYDIVGAESNKPQIITVGSISDPKAVSSRNIGTKFDNVNFAVGWGSGRATHRLNYAKIKTNGDVESGTIYGSDSKLSETDWCFAVGGITATTIERSTIEGSNKNCNLSFIHAAGGFDNTKPITSCSISGDLQGYGDHGPEFIGDVKIEFDRTDDAGDSYLNSGIYKTEYRLDNGAWETYVEGAIKTIASRGRHTIWYRSVDKAGNWEDTKTQCFKIIVTHEPGKPVQPSGPTSGKPDVTYSFSTRSTDIDGDQLYYMWDWGDSISSWMGPYKSGQTCSASHKWSNDGYYLIKVRAKDSRGAVSDWSEPLKININKARSKQTFSKFFIRFFDFIKEQFFTSRSRIGYTQLNKKMESNDELICLINNIWRRNI